MIVLINRYPQLLPVENEIGKAAKCLITYYQQGMKVLVCGNGGSCSDSDHIVGELMKDFEHKRPIEKSLKKQLIAFDCLSHSLSDGGEYYIWDSP